MSTVTENNAQTGTVTATENDIKIARVLERAQIAEQIKSAQELMARLNAQRVALCDRLQNDERETLLRFEEGISVTESASKDASKLRRERSMSDEDKTQIAAAKIAHVNLINQPQHKAQAARSVELAYLSVFKLVARKDGRVGVSVRGQI